MASEDLTQLSTRRKAALAAGERYYFTGKSCRRGHISKRYTVNKNCVSCHEALWGKREEVLIKKKQYREKNKEKTKAAVNNWHERNRKQVSAYHKKWRNEINPNAWKAVSVKRRSSKKNAEGGFSADDVSRMMAAQDGKCVCCKRDVRKFFHVDHIMPLALGGTNWPDNLQILCPSCNCSKGSKHPDTWIKEISAKAELVDA